MTFARLGGLSLAALVWALALSSNAGAAKAMISLDEASGPQVFAANDIEAALRARKITVRRESADRLNSYTPERVRIRFVDADKWGGARKLPSITSEGFALLLTKFEGHEDVFIIARDAGGAMYGGLELAEQIRVFGVEGVTETIAIPTCPCAAPSSTFRSTCATRATRT